MKKVEDRGVARHRAGVHTAPAFQRRPVRDDARAAVPLLPEDLDDEVIHAVVFERRIEVESPPGVGRGVGVLGSPLVYDERLPAVVVGVEVGDELRPPRVAERELEVIKITARESRAGVPLPPRDGPRYQAFLFQRQVLAPYGPGVSTPVEGKARHVRAFADDDVLLRRRGGARQNRRRYDKRHEFIWSRHRAPFAFISY